MFVERAEAQLTLPILLEREPRPRRVEQERIAAFGADHRVVAEQWPVAARDGLVLLLEPVAHLDPVRDAVAVGDQQGRPVVRLGLAERAQRLLGIGAHRDARDVHVGVGDRLQRQILRRHRLAGGGELRDRTERRRLRHLAAGIGIDLGVEHEHIDVPSAREDVIETARADVVGPAVAADDPHAAPDQVIDHAEQVGDERDDPVRRAAATARRCVHAARAARIRATAAPRESRRRTPDRAHRASRSAAAGRARCGGRRRGAGRARIRRCPQTASWTTPDRDRRR